MIAELYVPFPFKNGWKNINIFIKKKKIKNDTSLFGMT